MVELHGELLDLLNVLHLLLVELATELVVLHFYLKGIPLAAGQLLQADILFSKLLG